MFCLSSWSFTATFCTQPCFSPFPFQVSLCTIPWLPTHRVELRWAVSGLWCWLTSMISAWQNWASRVGKCYGKMCQLLAHSLNLSNIPHSLILLCLPGERRASSPVLWKLHLNRLYYQWSQKRWEMVTLGPVKKLCIIPSIVLEMSFFLCLGTIEWESVHVGQFHTNSTSTYLMSPEFLPFHTELRLGVLLSWHPVPQCLFFRG